MNGWLWIAGFFAAVAAVLLWRAFKGRREPGYLAVSEYWVYATGAAMPRIEKVMHEMVGANPHSRPHKPAVTTREGVLFSDLRLRMSAARRESNPHAFRPDLFEADAVPNPEVLGRLGMADVFMRLRYLSEVRLHDTRHLQFMPHLAAAVCRLVEGTLVYDPVSQVFYTAEEFAAALSADSNAERAEFHLRTVRKDGPEGVWHETRGLRKIGRRELRTDLQDADVDVLVDHLIWEVCLALFKDPVHTGPIEIGAFDDRFIATIEPERGETHLLRLGRVHSQT